MEQAMKLVHAIIPEDNIYFDMNFGIEVCFKDKYSYFIMYTNNDSKPIISIGEMKPEQLVAKITVQNRLEESCNNLIGFKPEGLQIQLLDRRINPAIIYTLLAMVESCLKK